MCTRSLAKAFSPSGPSIEPLGLGLFIEPLSSITRAKSSWYAQGGLGEGGGGEGDGGGGLGGGGDGDGGGGLGDGGGGLGGGGEGEGGGGDGGEGGGEGGGGRVGKSGMMGGGLLQGVRRDVAPAKRKLRPVLMQHFTEYVTFITLTSRNSKVTACFFTISFPPTKVVWPSSPMVALPPSLGCAGLSALVPHRVEQNFGALLEPRHCPSSLEPWHLISLPI